MWMAMFAFFGGVLVTAMAIRLAWRFKERDYYQGVEDAVLVLVSKGAHGMARKVRKELLGRKKKS
jgi:hypothetical protein